MPLVIALTEVVHWHQSTVRKRISYWSINLEDKSSGSVYPTKSMKAHLLGQMAQSLATPTGTGASPMTGEPSVKTALLSRRMESGTISYAAIDAVTLASIKLKKMLLQVETCPIGSNLLPLLTSTQSISTERTTRQQQVTARLEVVS